MRLRPYHYAWILCLVALIAFFALKPASHPVGGETAPTAIAGAENFGGDFTLTDHHGQTVTQNSWPDTYKILYFGFTFCPDVCPTGMSKISNALNTLPKETQDKIQPLFITVDPARDTTEILKTYTPLFYPRFIGLTGTDEQIEHMKKLYKVFAAKEGDSNTDYMINHSAFTYLLDPEGKLIALYSHDISATDMAADMKQKIR